MPIAAQWPGRAGPQAGRVLDYRQWADAKDHAMD
jgi:hypothetical protein